MNSIVLFVGGIILGILLSVSFISRIRPNSSESHAHASERAYTSMDIKAKIFNDYFNANETTRKVVSPSIIEASPFVSPSSAKSGSILEAKQKIKWAPGKESDYLNKLKAKVDNVQSEFSANTESQSTINSGEETKVSAADQRKEIRRSSRNKTKVSNNQEVVYNMFLSLKGSDTESVVNSKPSDAIVAAELSSSGVANIEKVPYHAQAIRDNTKYIPYVPTYKEMQEKNRPLPNMALQRAEYEKDNLKLHLCNAVFEAYSASYLTTKHHMLEVKSEGFNLTWVNCEMASFIHLKESNKFYSNPNQEGLIMQSLDVLDFSVIHLSAYERSSKKYKDILWKTKEDRKVAWTKIDPVIQAGEALGKLNNPKIRSPNRQIIYSEEAKRTVVIMPFLGGAMGAGHSELGNRFEYLKTCFWSIYEFMPNIVIGVTRQEDVDWGLKESGLPFYDVILISNLPKSAGLPVALTQQTKARLQDGRWDFDYIFFSESDQILISRELQLMYNHLKKYPGHMLLPHRLMPYSSYVVEKAHQRDISKIKYNGWMNQSCCMPRQNCIERKTWLHIKDNNVPIINYYGLFVPLGNVNFLDEQYRSCKLSTYVGDYCP